MFVSHHRRGFSLRDVAAVRNFEFVVNVTSLNELDVVSEAAPRSHQDTHEV